jgi:hypothetical protein
MIVDAGAFTLHFYRPDPGMSPKVIDWLPNNAKSLRAS